MLAQTVATRYSAGQTDMVSALLKSQLAVSRLDSGSRIWRQSAAPAATE
jgi:hypothetical protein